MQVGIFDTISAIHALKTVATVYGYDTLDETLRLIRATWEGVKQATNREFLVGVAEFVHRFGATDFENNLRMKSISAIWQDYLATTTSYNRATTDPAMRKSFCRAIVNQYNKGLHGKKRLNMEY